MLDPADASPKKIEREKGLASPRKTRTTSIESSNAASTQQPVVCKSTATQRLQFAGKTKKSRTGLKENFKNGGRTNTRPSIDEPVGRLAISARVASGKRRARVHSPLMRAKTKYGHMFARSENTDRVTTRMER